MTGHITQYTVLRAFARACPCLRIALGYVRRTAHGALRIVLYFAMWVGGGRAFGGCCVNMMQINCRGKGVPCPWVRLFDLVLTDKWQS